MHFSIYCAKPISISIISLSCFWKPETSIWHPHDGAFYEHFPLILFLSHPLFTHLIQLQAHHMVIIWNSQYHLCLNESSKFLSVLPHTAGLSLFHTLLHKAPECDTQKQAHIMKGFVFSWLISMWSVSCGTNYSMSVMRTCTYTCDCHLYITDRHC